MQKLPFFICILVLTSSLPIAIADYSPFGTVTNERTHLTYSTIQDAVTAALSGDTLTVGAGTYNEHVTVNKKLNINGVSIDTVIVDGTGTSDVFFITGDYVNITNMTIINNGGDTGIYLQGADHGFIIGCDFQNNNGANGGIYFDASSYNTVTGNDFNDSTVWAIMSPGDYNLFYHNNFFNCSAIDDVDVPPSTNLWNATYPTGGNYWYDHINFTDDFSGPLQNIPGADGFVDWAYTCGRSGVDYYPYAEPIDFTSLPPTISNPSPASDTTDISINRSTVSVTIADIGLFDYSIEGTYVVSKTETGVSSGVKTTTLITPLPYFEDIIWYVNASNADASVNATYTFTTQLAGVYDTMYVKSSYGPSDPQWRKDHWNDIQDAIDAVSVGGTVYVFSGTYNVGIGKLDNLWINKPITLQGENKDDTIIHGEAEHTGVVDVTIEVSTEKYPLPPSDAITNITIRDLTIETEWIPFFQSNCIYFRDVDNSIIDNCIIRGDSSGGWNGIVIDSSSSTDTISNCIITYLTEQNAISCLGTDILITGNNITHCYRGLFVYFANDAFVDGNIFHNNPWGGLIIQQADGTIVIENDFIHNGWDWTNPFMKNEVALLIEPGTTNTQVYHNNFFDSAYSPQAIDDTATTIWNKDYPVGGNYWSDLDEASENAYDHYSGPLQNATGPDGIVDYQSPQHYDIGGAGGASDSYPFIYPYTRADCQGADFTWTPKYPKPKEKVFFTESACTNEKIVKWTWVFGDGKQYESTKTSESNHIYTKEGWYTVKLIIQDNRGVLYTSAKRIYVGNGPHLFPPEPPKYPAGFTVPEMYALLRADTLPSNDAVVTVMVIDSGIVPQKYNNIDLNEIQQLSGLSKLIDENGHGTWVNYAVAYILQTKLPNSKQISYKVFDADGGTTTDAFLTALKKAKELHPDIVSISAGVIGGSPDDPFSQACEELRREGIIVIVAAGNFGPAARSIASPGCSDSVVSVAGSDPQWTDKSNPTLRLQKILDLKDDTICPWSSRGPVTDVDMKPDVTSPGESIRGPWLMTEKVVSGTSMATPLISGGTAIIFAQNKGTIDLVKSLYFWDKSVIPQTFEDALKASAYEKGDANIWGSGIVQFDKINGNFQMGLTTRLIIWFAFPLILLIIIILLLYYYYRERKGIYKKYRVPKWAKKL